MAQDHVGQPGRCLLLRPSGRASHAQGGLRQDHQHRLDVGAYRQYAPKPSGVQRVPSRRELECDFALERRIFGKVDGTHAALAEFFANLVPRDGAAGHPGNDMKSETAALACRSSLYWDSSREALVPSRF